MKITIKGSFKTGTDFYEETANNQSEFDFAMNKIMNNCACNWPSEVECKGHIPEYVKAYFSEETQTVISKK